MDGRRSINVSITGHRPERVAEHEKTIRRALLVAYEDLGAYRVIQGCAAGVDLWAASEAFIAGIPFVAARPWKGHKPRKADEFAYRMMMKNAEEVHNISDEEDFPGNWCYQRRNEWMVNRADYTIAVWDGVEKGGTFNCIQYAVEVKRPLYIIAPSSGEVTVVEPAR